jgi:GT2 family glycosyltransferase
LQPAPLITIAVPSLNQGRYLADALQSIFDQGLPVEVFLADGGSSDATLEVIGEFAPKLAGWRSHPDHGQAAAINECIARGRAPYVCWLNSDDMLVQGGLATLLAVLEADPALPAAYGRAWTLIDATQEKIPVWVEPFDPGRLARRCIISQPATLIRRSAWEAIGGLDENLHFAMDYDLWWRLFRNSGTLRFVDSFVAINRDHADTKSTNNRYAHYREGAAVVARHHGEVPAWIRLVPLHLRWRLARLKHWLTRS